MSLLTTLIDEEGHDSLRHDVSNVLLNKVEVRLDQVLDNPSFHYHTTAFLVRICTHFVRDLRKYDWR